MRRREEYLKKMMYRLDNQNKKYKNLLNNNFLGSNNNNILNENNKNCGSCLSPNNFFWSIENKDSNKKDSVNENKSVVPITTQYPYPFENKIKKRIKSVICKDLLAENKYDQWHGIKKKLEHLSNNATDFNDEDSLNDCLYLHLLFPAEEEVIENKTITTIEFFYEVGCRIYEINKFYK